MERSIIGPCLFLILALALPTLPPARAVASTLGGEPFSDVRIFEESSEALCSWYGEGLRDLPLIHVGAHPVFFSPDADFDATGMELQRVLEGKSCGELADRTSGYLRKDSLYTSENFALAGHRLGVVRELWWVVPSRTTLSEGELEPIKAWMGKTFGLPMEFISTLRHEGPTLQGEWKGLSVRLCSLEDLPLMGDQIILSVDTDFLVKLYENPVRSGMLDQLGWFFSLLQKKKLKGAAVSVAAGGGEVPLAFRYVALRVRDFLSDPKAFEEGPPESWRRQQQFEYLDFMLARDDALVETERMAALDLSSPLPWYDRAVVAARRGQAEKVEELLQEMVARDSAYRRGYVELGEILYGLGVKEETLALLRRGREDHPGDLRIGIVLVNILGDLEMRAEAVEVAVSLAEKNPSVPLLHLVSAGALLAAGKEEDAVMAMESFRRTAPPGGWRERILPDPAGLLLSPGGGSPSILLP